MLKIDKSEWRYYAEAAYKEYCGGCLEKRCTMIYHPDHGWVGADPTICAGHFDELENSGEYEIHLVSSLVEAARLDNAKT